MEKTKGSAYAPHKHRELFWLLGTITLVLLGHFLLFGKQGFVEGGTADINIHDTYLIFPNVDMILLLGVFLFLIVYSVRTVGSAFKNRIASLICMAAIIGFIALLTGIHSIAQSLLFETLATALIYVQLVLSGFLVFIGFKTGQHSRK